MKAISDQLHAALMNVLTQLPHGQVDQLIIGLRAAPTLPQPLAEQIHAAAAAHQRTELAAELAKLTPPAGEPPNGESKHVG